MSFLLERGDLVLTAGSSPLAKLVRVFSRPPTEKYPSHVNHVAIVHQRGGLDDVRILEWDRRVREGRLIDYHRNDRVWVYRPRDITSSQIDHVLGAIGEKWRNGETYGYLEFLTQAFDNALPGSPRILRRLNGIIPGAQCSTGTALLLREAGIDFGIEPTPFDMASQCEDDPIGFERIASGIRPSEWLTEAA